MLRKKLRLRKIAACECMVNELGLLPQRRCGNKYSFRLLGARKVMFQLKHYLRRLNKKIDGDGCWQQDACAGAATHLWVTGSCIRPYVCSKGASHSGISSSPKQFFPVNSAVLDRPRVRTKKPCLHSIGCTLCIYGLSLLRASRKRAGHKRDATRGALRAAKSSNFLDL